MASVTFLTVLSTHDTIPMKVLRRSSVKLYRAENSGGDSKGACVLCSLCHKPCRCQTQIRRQKSEGLASQTGVRR